MLEEGMVEVTNPSRVFIAERLENAAGEGIAVTMEGTRPLLVEVQALVSPSSLAYPRRTANGVDANRLQLLTAVLNKRAGLKLAEQDVYVNLVGGLRVRELPVVMHERAGGVSSITTARSIYYMSKVLLALVLDAIRQPRQ
jgi:DNA repair protein RadA/Sms